MDDNFTGSEVLFIVGLVIFISLFFGLKLSENMHQREAVKAGVAEWVINNENGSTKFQYIKIQ